MEVNDKLDEVIGYVRAARSVPMSASAMVNRQELTGKLEDVSALLTANLAEAEKLITERDLVLAEAREQAGALLESAREQQRQLLSEHGLVAAAEQESERIVAQGQAAADSARAEADAYSDERLANFEVVLERLLTAVRGGRTQLAHDLPEHAFDEVPAAALTSNTASVVPATREPLGLAAAPAGTAETDGPL